MPFEDISGVVTRPFQPHWKPRMVNASPSYFRKRSLFWYQERTIEDITRVLVLYGRPLRQGGNMKSLIRGHSLLFRSLVHREQSRRHSWRVDSVEDLLGSVQSLDGTTSQPLETAKPSLG